MQKYVIPEIPYGYTFTAAMALRYLMRKGAPGDGVNHHYFPVRHFCDEHDIPLTAEDRFDLENNRPGEPSVAMQLVDAIVQRQGLDGMCRFFLALTHEPYRMTADEKEKNNEYFKTAMQDVIAPYFYPYLTKGLAIKGGEVLFHGTATIIGGMHHAPLAAHSIHKLAKKVDEACEKRESPDLDVVEKLLPLLPSMHAITQYLIDTYNGMHVKSKNPPEPLPKLPPLDTLRLQKAIDRTHDSSAELY